MISDTRTKPTSPDAGRKAKAARKQYAASKRYIDREIYDQLLRPQPAPDAGALRKTKKISLQAAADSLQVWPSALSRLERGLTRDDIFRYQNWPNNH